MVILDKFREMQASSFQRLTVPALAKPPTRVAETARSQYQDPGQSCFNYVHNDLKISAFIGHYLKHSEVEDNRETSGFFGVSTLKPQARRLFSAGISRHTRPRPLRGQRSRHQCVLRLDLAPLAGARVENVIFAAHNGGDFGHTLWKGVRIVEEPDGDCSIPGA
ncbi:hypothetical protein [Pararhodobacter zhoushanensis]|uniref:hypothetical protein n=1 Tax=Pararhodobacter zhoushanensis TaxID=2479545 RepID=UPI001FE92740|nr:hypothetical protein [Pararhodobacter zhoushanensis]